ncbi:hypothetical protein ABW19_dt0207307 [Dactylella cylindrospora]|nr:hypothetical protein ABW19_dt0207307 [Dactylella cylindrospora]
MANLPASSSPIPSSEPETTATSKPLASATSTTPLEEAASKKDDSLAVTQEPDTAVAVADQNGHRDSGSVAKNITAPLSPPIPTPPFNDSFDTSAPQEQHAMNNLSLDSPEATSTNPSSNSQQAPVLSVTGESSISEQPNTAIPAVVNQPTSDVRDEPKPAPVDVDMEDAAPAADPEPKVEEPKPAENIPSDLVPQAAAQDSEMPDAPAHVSSPPSAIGSSLVRPRSESAEPERPNKRQKTEEPESLPDAAALEHPAVNTNGASTKAELPSPIEMDTSMDQTAKSDEAAKEGVRDAETETTTDKAKDDQPTMPEHQVRFVIQVLKSIKRVKDATAFTAPVDVIKHNIPHYYEIIKNPMCIQDMERKLTSNEYHNPDELKADWELMIQNTITFNGAEHAITMAGKRIQEKFLLQLERLPPLEPPQKKKPQPKRPVVSTAEATAAPAAETATPVAGPNVETRVRRESTRASAPNSAMSPTAASPTFSLTPGGVPQIRRDSIVTADGRPKRPIHAPPPKDLPYSDLKPRRKKSVAEFKFCEGIMKELYKKQHSVIAYPFYDPVDPVALGIPDYFKIIKKPMDMSEINRKLTQNEYNNSNEFEADIRLMFNNCYKFNPQGSPVYSAGKSLEAIFDEKWSQKPSFKEETPTPPVEEEEEEEEEEESEDEASPQLEKLEAQLSRLTSEIETIRKQKKVKKSSPAPKGHKKKASVSGPSIKAATAKTAATTKKKSATKKKPEVAPYMTFAQKQELSERINTLSPAKMHQALNLIKANHPNLAQDGSDEIELDIDELAPATLHKLYKFVNDNTLAPEKTAPPFVPAAKPTKNAPAPKPRKKNKPMSATEQERKIRELERQIEGFEGASPTEDGPRSLASMGPTNKDAESSSDDDSSSGSESEEE